MDGPRKRHCWECRRRCLVCDSTEPVCKRCSASGIECLGYGDVKPVRFKWLAPGRVKSRGRKRNRSPSDESESNCSDIITSTTTELAYTTINTHLAISRFEMRTEACILAEAAKYFNSCIYQDLIPIQELGRNPHIYPLSDTHLQVAAISPDYLRYGMLCMTLSHRINRTRSEPQYKALIHKFYLYWGLALRSLSEQLDTEERRSDDMVLAGVLTLLLTDVQQGTSLNWRCHLEGVYKLIALRGGLQAVAGSRSLEPLLLVLLFIAVIGNTTCPASDLTMTGSQFDALDFLLERFSVAVSSFHTCPLPLFAEIIKTNHLRTRATRHCATRAEDLSQEAYEILERIHCFSPEGWAESKDLSREDWLLIGKVYRAAVALYCILSLQSLSVLPTTPMLRAHCASHGQLLTALVNEGLSSQRMKRFMIWPLVVLGVEAVHGGAAMRAFIAKLLPEMSRDVGTYVPLTAKRVLESFWGSGETRWDACFDRPYAFTTQIAVDISRMLLLTKGHAPK
ncbi:fungal-specific transcription factor domain-containing protein [Hypoxylon crocopeplum]|nr:fungal-specific transcription factor domain-containing protein [Hypoxylon crocopeplum]